MQESLYVTGIVLKQTPFGEYDRRVCLLTREKGKITAFARGARKPGNRLAAATNPFAFGSFRLYEGRNSYTISEAEIRNYFPELMTDYVGACYGMYFAEVADFYCRENNDEKEMMKLVYQSLRALCAPALPNELVRSIFELKAIVVNGEYPGVPEERKLKNHTVCTELHSGEFCGKVIYLYRIGQGSCRTFTDRVGISEAFHGQVVQKS